MISEFQQLSQKIEQLAQAVFELRSQNAQLRLEITGLRQQNDDANARIKQAHGRVAALLEHLPPDPCANDMAEDGDGNGNDDSDRAHEEQA